METIIVEILLGMVGETLEFMLPAHIQLGSLMDDIIRLTEQVNQNVMLDRERAILYDISRGSVLYPEWTLAQNNVQDGNRLVLI